MVYREKYFFEIPVYRCSAEDYQAEIKALEAEHINNYGSLEYIWLTLPLNNYRKAGSWRFNQIIGYLRLFVDFGNNVIKAEYWRIEQRRIPKHQSKKKFMLRGGNAIEVWFLKSETSKEIYTSLIENLEALQKEKRFKNRFIDLNVFREIGPFVDWRSFIDS